MQKRPAVILGVIVLFALVLRLAVFFQLKADYPYFLNPPEGTDMFSHHKLALEHLNGTFKQFPHYLNALYPYFLAAIYFIFGKNMLAPLAIQLILGCVNCILAYFIAKEIFGRRAGLLAALITAVYAPFIIYELTLLVESLLTFLLALTIWLVLLAKRKTSYLFGALAGLSFGLSVLARGSSLILLPVFILFFTGLRPKAKKVFLLAGVFLVFCFAVVSVITVQNYVLGGKPVLISTNFGVNFAAGNCPGAYGWFHYPDWLKAAPERQKVSFEDSDFWFRETMRAVWQAPGAWLKLMLRKFCLFWNHWEIPNNINQEAVKQYSPTLRYFPLFTFGTAIPLAFAGMILAFRKFKSAGLLYAFLFIYMASVVAIHIADRYRLPFVQVAVIFSAFTVSQAYVKMRERNFRYLAMLVLLVAASLVSAHAYDIYLGVENFTYRITHPRGTYIFSDNKSVVIRDDTGNWQGRSYTVLNSEFKRARKKIILEIDRPLAQVKNAYLEFMFACPQKQGQISLQVNQFPAARIKCEEIYTGEKANFMKVAFDPAWLVKGENSFVFSVADQGVLALFIDTRYNYRRSEFSSDGGLRWGYPGKGEYITSLYLGWEDGAL